MKFNENFLLRLAPVYTVKGTYLRHVASEFPFKTLKSNSAVKTKALTLSRTQ